MFSKETTRVITESGMILTITNINGKPTVKTMEVDPEYYKNFIESRQLHEVGKGEWYFGSEIIKPFVIDVTKLYIRKNGTAGTFERHPTSSITYLPNSDEVKGLVYSQDGDCFSTKATSQELLLNVLIKEQETFHQNVEAVYCNDELGTIINSYTEHNSPVGHIYTILNNTKHVKLQFQTGPIKENGVNGLTSEDLLRVLIHRTTALNTKFPCKENETALYHLEKALQAFNDRTKNRQARGVEGLNKA